MLAAISTTTLSRRSCALTGSAITSRSLRNSTRGPPSAPRIIEVLQPRPGPQPRLRPNHVRIATVSSDSAAAYASGYSQWPMQGASQSPMCPQARFEGDRSRLIKPVKRVQGADCKIRLRGFDQDGELYLRRGDGEDIDLLGGQGLEGLGGNAGMAAHADANDRDFGNVGRPIQPLIADCILGLVEGDPRALIVRGWNREGEVGGRPVGRDVLHDHIHVDVVVRKRAEDRGGDAGRVLLPPDRDLCLVL